MVMSVGDYIVCTKPGIWEVTANEDSRLWLKSLEGDTLWELSNKSQEIIRKVLSIEEIHEIISRICFVRTLTIPNEKMRKSIYEEALHSYDPLLWISLIKTIYFRKESQRLFDGELNYEIMAKSFFHGEISAVLNIPFNSVENMIASTIENDTW